jgi:hypothetical protein
MALYIRQGDSLKFTDTITGLVSLSGYTCKAYIYDKNNTVLSTVTGSASGLVVTYEKLHTYTKAWPVGKYDVETKIWDSSGHYYTTNKIVLTVDKTIEEDPS